MTKYLLDSDICIFAIRSNQAILSRIGSLAASEWAISAVTVFELAKGIELRPRTKASFAGLMFLEQANALPLTVDVANAAAKVHANLNRQGTKAGIADELIAGHALVQGLTLVTNNTKHFEAIPGLKLENWL